MIKGKKASSHLATAIALPLAAVIAGNIPAQAVTFNLSFAPGTTQEQIVGVKMAADIWSQYLVDDHTVNLYVGMNTQDLGTGIIGAATPGLVSNMSYTKYYNSLKDDKTSLLDNLAVASLTNSSAYNFLINGTPYSNNQLIATTANAKAVGINTSGTNNQYGALDGYIQFDPNRAWSYDYIRSGNIKNKQYDFLSTAIHEMGHILGFVSSVDQPLDPISKTLRATPLDLFRYSTDTSGVSSIDLSTSVQAYFQADTTGSTKISGMSSGAAGSPQASHWVDSKTPLGIMVGTLKTGVRYNITALDLKVFDAIGYNISNPSLIDLTKSSTFITTLQTTAQAYATTATVVDRSADVQQMKIDSITYGWGWNGYWEEAEDTGVETVPEPASTFGLLVMALLGIASRWKRQLVPINRI